MMMACFARLYIHVINLFIKIIAMLNSVAKLNTFFFTMFYYVSVATTVCWEMFAVEYFGEFRELYTTRENKNCQVSLLLPLIHGQQQSLSKYGRGSK